MKRVAMILGLLTVGACAAAPPPPPAEAPSSIPAPPVAPAPQPVADMCGARDMQGLVGKPRSEIPVPVKPDLQRVACTTCAVTMDFNPQRLNFFFDAQTGLIKEVRCG